MDKNTKVMATTPFSISDILTKNNTSIYKKCMSSPLSQSSGHLSDVETASHPSLEAQQPHCRQSDCVRTPPREYLADHGENLSLIYKKYHSLHDNGVRYNGMADGIDGKDKRYFSDRNLGKRRSSLDCFLVDANHNTDREKISAIDGKGTVPGYYNYPMPLDMRRCVNDSGE